VSGRPGKRPAPAGPDAAGIPAGREPYIGRPMKRKEDPRLLRGAGQYLDDLRLSDLLHVEVLRSPYAHARILALDTRAAKAAPGVVGVYTHAELASRCGRLPAMNPGMKGLRAPERYPLARGEMNFVGEPVAAVVAQSRSSARDALELISVHYEPLEPVVDPEAALKPDAPRVHAEYPDNVSFRWEVKGGDLEAAFRSAYRVIEERIQSQRLIPCAMEGRGVISFFDPGEESLTVWSSTQIPHILRSQLALMLNLGEERVRVIVPEVGGAFGSKLNVYAEEGLLGALARFHPQKHLKWVEGRRENFSGTIHGRDQIGKVKVAIDREGKLLGIRYDAIADLGAYHQLFTPAIPTNTGTMLAGAYHLPAAHMTLTGVFTNKMSTDAYRGAGRPEATYVIERVMDLIASELNLDPTEVRRRNFQREFPHTTVTGATYDSGDYQKALDRAMEVAGYQKLREEQRAARAAGRLVGIGVSSYVEICAMGPSKAMGFSGWESATVRVSPTGKVEVLTGVCPNGQGQETSFAQIAADVLGAPYDDIRIHRGDTARVAWGVGTFGSRATAIGGSAVFTAAGKIAAKMKAVAAAVMEVPLKQVAREGTSFRAGKKTLSFAEVAFHAYRGLVVPEGMTSGLEETSFWEPKNFTFPFGTHICRVEIDEDTGQVEITGYWAVDDCGRAINPLLIDGQIHGGMAQGIGQALFEEAVYDQGGQLITGTLMDYAVPKANQLPRFHCHRTETPTDVNPLGVKGVGEAGTIGATPAVVNAVVDGLRPLGVRHLNMPLRPERIWRAIREGRARGREK
jgi:carbon-monoxide dehydrogenase large subunit